MKILQINCVYDSGSTGRLVSLLHNNYLKYGHDSFVCYGRGARSFQSSVEKVSSELEAYTHSILSRLLGVDFAFSPLSTRKTIEIIKATRTDIVHLHCLNGHFVNVYALLDFLKLHNIPTILTLHAEIMHTAGCEHSYDCDKWQTGCNSCPKIRGVISRYFRDDSKYCFNKMKKAFHGFEKIAIVGVSEWLTERARKSAIFNFGSSSFRTIYNGVDSDVFRRISCTDAQEKCIARTNTILHVTPDFTHPLKGGHFVIELAQRMPDCKFVIVGFNGDATQLPTNVSAIKHTNSQHELARLYSSADVTLLTSKRETFSMVCAESLCCGTPVVGFKAGAPESISLCEHSTFVDYGDLDAMEKQLRIFLNTSHDHAKIEQKAHKRYSSDVMVSNYLNLYEKLS